MVIDLKHVIWSNIDLDTKDWKEGYKEFLEINNLDDNPDDEYALYSWMVDMNNEYLNDEKMNLDKMVDGDILVIADIGLWNGRRCGYKILGNNLNEIFDINSRGFDLAEFYGDGHNIKATEVHHDGINYYEFRIIRNNKDIEKMFNGKEITRARLNYYTKPMYKEVASVYGWR